MTTRISRILVMNPKSGLFTQNLGLPMIIVGYCPTSPDNQNPTKKTWKIGAQFELLYRSAQNLSKCLIFVEFSLGICTHICIYIYIYIIYIHIYIYNYIYIYILDIHIIYKYIRLNVNNGNWLPGYLEKSCPPRVRTWSNAIAIFLP